MDLFPANAIEDPFLGAQHDPATQGHRGSSPQRSELDLHLPFTMTGSLARVSSGGSGGTGAGDDPCDPHSQGGLPYSHTLSSLQLPPAPTPNPSPTEAQLASFGESLAADTLARLHANWTYDHPAAQLQPTICPEAVRPGAVNVKGLGLGLEDHDLPPYNVATSNLNRPHPNDALVVPTYINFDVPTDQDAYTSYEADSFHRDMPLYDLPWNTHHPASSFSSFSGTGFPSHPDSGEGLVRFGTWPTNSNFTPRQPRRIASTTSVLSTDSWTTAVGTPTRASATLPKADLPRTPCDAPQTPNSPALSPVDTALDITSELSPEEDAPHESIDYDDDITVVMDSPEQVWHQLTDPIDAPEGTEVASEDDDNYVDGHDDNEYEVSAKKPVRQSQNHRRTFKQALWETINDSAFNDLIYWADDGRSGIIPDKKKFQTSKAMRSITDARDFGGFVRQLHMWGFSRFKVAELGERSCGFKHKDFQRGRLDLLDEMKRKGETKVMRPTPSKRKAASRKKRSRASATAAPVSSSPIKPKGAPRPRKTTAKAKPEASSSNAPADNLKSLPSSPAVRLRSMRAPIPPPRLLHRESSERDSPLPATRKLGKIPTEPPFSHTRAMTTSSPTAGPSKKKGTPKRRAPSPDPSYRPPKRKTRTTGSRA